jgi:hypothetical protein
MLMVRDETARILDGLSLADSIPEDAFADGSFDTGLRQGSVPTQDEREEALNRSS